MSKLADLTIFDLRPQLKVIKSLSRRKRQGDVTHLTLHYNGPEVSGFGDPNRELRQVIDIDVPNHQSRIGGDSLMYHFVVLSDGSIYQTRDLDLIAWHTRDQEGNEHSLGIHLPIGGAQDATSAQWHTTTDLFEALIDEFTLAGRSAVKGHQEWPGASTQCPGSPLMHRLKQWRSGGESFDGPMLFRIKPNIALASVREGPGRDFPVALSGMAFMWPGDTLMADKLVAGERIGHEDRWAHRLDGVGFVHVSLLDVGA
jgi:N-acetylmuramoyl-L-alanine amidase